MTDQKLNAKTAHELIHELEDGDDVQGMDWTKFGNNMNRDYFRYVMDTKTKNYFNRLSEKPDHMPEQAIGRNLYARAKKFIPIRDISNHHFQLHHNFKALSPNTFLYPTKTHLEILNVPNLKKTNVLDVEQVTCIDNHVNLVACAHGGRHISLINLESPGIEVRKFYLNME